ncbi:peptidoglycan-binding domain-containing protein [Streptomyces sp. NPDC047072]|uniref:peptidoglycan-binding domain-containing protein n=1 Tax=Streptomyces sp. NPDC047072 TaxID=3154809 RepID=UPI003407E970
MSEPPGLVCPECGAPRTVDGTPSCSCAERASDAHREARSAEAAAAEDFDPVRIRPFVEVGDDSGSPAEEMSVPAGEPPVAPVDFAGTEGDALPAAEPLSGPDPDVSPRSWRRRKVLIAGAGAAAALLVTGCFVGGLFSYDDPARDSSVAGGVRAGLPEGEPSANGPSAGSSLTATPSETSASPSSSPSPSPTDGTATPTPSATPTGAPSSSATAAPGPTASNGQPPVLSLGDRGPEVVELQLRLKQAGFYSGDADGNFDEDVRSAVRTYQFARLILDEESGVYGPVTRASLESETTEP